MADSGSAKTALVLGGTGETGKIVVQELQDSSDIAKVIMINRRNVDVAGDKIEQRIVDYDKLDEHADAFKDADLAFCCLGTTRAKAGKEGFVKVDYDYVVNSAQKLKDGGTCKSFHLLTSYGSNPNAWTLYPSTKGKAEEACKKMEFDRLSIYRPKLLLTPRSETRTFERFAQGVANAVDKAGRASIQVSDLGKAMVFNATKKSIGEKVEILEHAPILAMAKEAKPAE